MMYAKLALRNVKRSAKDYLIYVITLILSGRAFLWVHVYCKPLL